jgi:hypothetical protein
MTLPYDRFLIALDYKQRGAVEDRRRKAARGPWGADGPKVAKWAEENLNLSKLHEPGLPKQEKSRRDTLLKNLNKWRAGQGARTDQLDRFMVFFGRSLTALPDDVWLDKKPVHEAPKKQQNRFTPVPVKSCLECGKAIERPKGMTPYNYKQRKYCSKECGNLAPRSNNRLFVRSGTDWKRAA